MRFFLLIPAFLLFLSNVPFVHKMEMKDMASMMKDGCCKSDSRKGSCHKEASDNIEKENNHCGKKAVEESNKPCGQTTDQQCGKASESTCVCICCFQFAAPDQVGTKLHFGCNNNKQILAEYMQRNWKDPLLSLPWQPPDGVALLNTDFS